MLHIVHSQFKKNKKKIFEWVTDQEKSKVDLTGLNINFHIQPFPQSHTYTCLCILGWAVAKKKKKKIRDYLNREIIVFKSS